MDRSALEDVFRQLEKFGSLRELQRVLRAHQTISGRSFTDIRDNIWAQEDEDAWEAVRDYAAQVLVFGSKSFQLLSVSRDVKQTARAFAEARDSLSPENVLDLGEDESEARQRFVGILYDQSSLTLIFRSKKTFTKNTPIEEDWVLPEHRGRVAEADEAYLVEAIKVSVVETLEIPYGARHGSVRVVTTLDGYSAEERPDAAAQRLVSLAAQILEVDEDDFSSVDLFPAIRNIYDDGAEGRVVEMHFDCSTGAGRTEKMRRSTTDLRREAYHIAGVHAATINPYRISVRWESPRIGRADVTLPGIRRMLHQAERPRLTVAHVSPAMGRDAYLYVMQRIAGKL
jgi:hypothetical protein